MDFHLSAGYERSVVAPAQSSSLPEIRPASLRLIQPLSMTLEQSPDGTEILSPRREPTQFKLYGVWYPQVVSTDGFDPFDIGTLAVYPDGKTLYVNAGRGQWLLVRPSPEHFSDVGNQSRPNSALGDGSTGLTSPGLGAQGIVRPPESVGKARGVREAQAHVVPLNVSLSDAKLGRVEDPNTRAFTGDFAKHQKAYVSYEVIQSCLQLAGKCPLTCVFLGQIDALNVHRKQIYIRAPRKGPYSRSRIAQLLARDIERAWTTAKTRGECPLWSGEEVGLEQVFLLDVRRVSRGGIKVALSFMPRCA
ncbi:hypothetical protein C8T65DRAFT_639405 [Cerioporus squamosus]|nr:hypothetical protein C8T65DRAFT_639405 [Cerioporus squamosus]